MKLIRYGMPGEEKPGLQLEDGRRVDVSGFGEDYDAAFYGSDGSARLAEWIPGRDLADIPADARLGPPVKNPSKLICIGLNYSDHARESGMAVPVEPVIFFKATSAVCGPFDPVILPPGSTKTDWEVELAVVIGRRANYVSQEQAAEHVAGYMIHNDYSERAYQLERGGQWVKGKSCDTFAPVGPYLATGDELSDPHNLRLWLKVNEETMQDGNTSNLVFDIPYLVSYLSHFMSLLPGDIISTGTPAGVGLGLVPPRFLKKGDVVELGIDGLGVMRQEVQSFKPNLD